jgi:Flp pilus assembly protein TadD
MKRFMFVVGAMLLASCSNIQLSEMSSFADSSASVLDTSRADYYTDDQLIITAKAQFREGNYGKAYSGFKQAINENPKDPAAWFGYAAAADMLRRFDESKKAYARLQPVIGRRLEFHNNLGYSYLLQGDLVSARREFLKAYDMDPKNEVTANNLQLLRNSYNYPKRGADQMSGI